MTIITTMTATYRRQLFEAGHDHRIGGHTFNLALYGNSAQLSATTPGYTTVGEVAGPGYSAGGQALTNVNPVIENEGAFATFGSPVDWPNSTIIARGCLIYNVTQGNASVSCHDFGRDYESLNGLFRLNMPFGSLAQAILRLV